MSKLSYSVFCSNVAQNVGSMSYSVKTYCTRKLNSVTNPGSNTHLINSYLLCLFTYNTREISTQAL